MDQILKALAAGIGTDKLLEDYPELEKEDIEVALLYAAKLEVKIGNKL